MQVDNTIYLATSNEEFEEQLNDGNQAIIVDEGRGIHIKLRHSKDTDEIQIVGGSIALMDRLLRAAVTGAPLNHHDIEMQDTAMRLLLELQTIRTSHNH